jgi:hypothetical protein
MNTMKLTFFFALSLVLGSCVNVQYEESEYVPEPWNPLEEQVQIDDAILATQQLLVGKLTSHVDDENLDEAVHFCAKNAQTLTDSMSQVLGYNIRRISPRNRNEKNALNSSDELAFAHFEKSLNAGAMSKYYVDENSAAYYTPILLGMPLCLQCHGKPEERKADAYTLIEQYYPNDKAINYDLGALRGMWKVTEGE